jgi:DNA-binding transcriptional ArsR family regulator
MEAKTEEFTQEQQRSAAAAKLLSHPARIAILKFLSKQTTCYTGKVITEIPLSRGTVHQHLNLLKEAGWVKGSISGSKISYCVDYKTLNRDAKPLLDLFSSFKKKNSSC